MRAVEEDGGVRVSDLVQRLGVSDMTVRRDIESLAGKGLVRKVHGGATRADDHSVDELGFSLKAELNQLQKSEIARTAASLVSPGTSVGISAGTTTYAVAAELRATKRLTVVTNSPLVADMLHDPAREDRTVVLTGGVRTPSDALAGPVADRMLADLHLDTLLLGVHGIDLEAGLTTPNLLEAQTNRMLIAAARRLIVVADHTKWGIIGLSSIADLGVIDILVTDAELDAEARREITDQVGRLIVAPKSAEHAG